MKYRKTHAKIITDYRGCLTTGARQFLGQRNTVAALTDICGWVHGTLYRKMNLTQEPNRKMNRTQKPRGRPLTLELLTNQSTENKHVMCNFVRSKTVPTTTISMVQELT